MKMQLSSLTLAASFGITTSFHVQSTVKPKLHSTSTKLFAADGEAKKNIVIIGGGWGGLSCAHTLGCSDSNVSVTVVDAANRVGGLVRDGYMSMNGTRKAEAGQHGFWDNYHNIFNLMENELPINVDDVLTGYDLQGQYSPKGLEAVWPVYRSNPQLPTGLAQALYTTFENLSVIDRLTAFPLVLAFSEFDNSKEAWEQYDKISFRDLCVKLGVSRKCYEEAFEPMILTGLFAPGEECSAAAALGMAYFFVLKSQNSFDVRWCKGNIGDKIFQPWVEYLENKEGNSEVNFLTSTRVIGFEGSEGSNDITKVICQSNDGEHVELEADTVVFGVGGSALNGLVRNSPLLAKHAEFRKFANLRGLSVLATRLYFDRFIDTKYSANACWGFDEKVGQTFFDITKLHGIDDAQGSIIEVDYYNANSLLVMDDETIVKKVKKDLDTMIGKECVEATVIDAAVVSLNNAVNWYAPGSYKNMPSLKSSSISNAYFVGDLVKTDHGSWSQEKAFVTGKEAANLILGNAIDKDIIPLSDDEIHVAAGRKLVSMAKEAVGLGDKSRAPSLVDFLW